MLFCTAPLKAEWLLDRETSSGSSPSLNELPLIRNITCNGTSAIHIVNIWEDAFLGGCKGAPGGPMSSGGLLQPWMSRGTSWGVSGGLWWRFPKQWKNFHLSQFCVGMLYCHVFAQNSLFWDMAKTALSQSVGATKRKLTKLSLLSFTVNRYQFEAGHKSWGFQRTLREADQGLTLNLICCTPKEAALEKCPHVYTVLK